jgi:hypothetical protein
MKTIANLKISYTFGTDSSQDFSREWFDKQNPHLIDSKIKSGIYLFRFFFEEQNNMLEIIINMTNYDYNSLFTLLLRINNIICNSLGTYPSKLIKFEKCKCGKYLTFNIITERVPF